MVQSSVKARQLPSQENQQDTGRAGLLDFRSRFGEHFTIMNVQNKDEGREGARELNPGGQSRLMK